MPLLLFSVCSTLDTESQVAILQPFNHSQSQTPTSFVRQGDISCSNAQDSSLEAPPGFESIRCERGVGYPEFGLAPVSCGEVGGRRGRCGCGGLQHLQQRFRDFPNLLFRKVAASVHRCEKCSDGISDVNK